MPLAAHVFACHKEDGWLGGVEVPGDPGGGGGQGGEGGQVVRWQWRLASTLATKSAHFGGGGADRGRLRRRGSSERKADFSALRRLLLIFQGGTEGGAPGSLDLLLEQNLKC